MFLKIWNLGTKKLNNRNLSEFRKFANLRKIIYS